MAEVASMSVKHSGRSDEDILKRAVAVCRAIRSYRVVQMETQEHLGSRTQAIEERIQVGHDSHSRRREEEGDGDPHEELIFRGETYWRKSAGEWEKPILVAAAATSVVTRWEGTDSEPDPFRSMLDGGLFKVLNLSNITRLPDEEIGGRLLMRFREESEIKGPTIEAKEWHRQFRNSFPRPDIAPPMPEEAVRFLSPEQIKFVDDLWLGKGDLLLYRSESQLEFHNRGELTARVHTTREYSDFNTAELPGPLPEA
jgi:hypothetical protein